MFTIFFMDFSVETFDSYKIDLFILISDYLLGCGICASLFLLDRKEFEKISKNKGILLLLLISTLIEKQAKPWKF